MGTQGKEFTGAPDRKTDTAAYKLAAVKVLTDQKLSVAEVARRLEVRETRPRAWRKVVVAGGDAAFPGHGHATPAEDERRRLRTEVTRFKAEQDPLKKAAADFANPPSGPSGSSPTTRTSGR